MSEQLKRTSKVQSFMKLIRADRPIGYLLLLWPTLWSLWLAGNGQPKPFLVVIFTIGVFVMRSAGCVVNDIFDKNLDSSVERTKERPLVLGSISIKEAWGVFFLLVLLAFILVLQLNQQVLLYAVIGLGLTIIYPLFKRFFLLHKWFSALLLVGASLWLMWPLKKHLIRFFISSGQAQYCGLLHTTPSMRWQIKQTMKRLVFFQRLGFLEIVTNQLPQ